MTELIKYEPWTVLQTWDDRLYFSNKPIKSVEEARSKMDMLNVGGEFIRSSDVKRIYEEKFGIAGLTSAQQSWLQNRRRSFESNLGRKPNEKEISNMVARMRREGLA